MSYTLVGSEFLARRAFEHINENGPDYHKPISASLSIFKQAKGFYNALTSSTNIRFDSQLYAERFLHARVYKEGAESITEELMYSSVRDAVTLEYTKWFRGTRLHPNTIPDEIMDEIVRVKEKEHELIDELKLIGLDVPVYDFNFIDRMIEAVNRKITKPVQRYLVGLYKTAATIASRLMEKKRFETERFVKPEVSITGKQDEVVSSLPTAPLTDVALQPDTSVKNSNRKDDLYELARVPSKNILVKKRDFLNTYKYLKGTDSFLAGNKIDVSRLFNFSLFSSLTPPAIYA